MKTLASANTQRIGSGLMTSTNCIELTEKTKAQRII